MGNGGDNGPPSVAIVLSSVPAASESHAYAHADRCSVVSRGWVIAVRGSIPPITISVVAISVAVWRYDTACKATDQGEDCEQSGHDFFSDANSYKEKTARRGKAGLSWSG
jgi:hypothetical protein